MGMFPLSRRRTGAIAGGLGAGAGFIAASLLKGTYADVRDSVLLYALIMFLASYFFISVTLEVLNRLNARYAEQP